MTGRPARALGLALGVALSFLLLPRPAGEVWAEGQGRGKRRKRP